MRGRVSSKKLLTFSAYCNEASQGRTKSGSWMIPVAVVTDILVVIDIVVVIDDIVVATVIVVVVGMLLILFLYRRRSVDFMCATRPRNGRGRPFLDYKYICIYI